MALKLVLVEIVLVETVLVGDPLYILDWSVNCRLILSNKVEIQIYVWNRKIANIYEFLE